MKNDPIVTHLSKGPTHSLPLSDLKNKYILWRTTNNFAKSTIQYDDIKMSILTEYTGVLQNAQWRMYLILRIIHR